MMQAMQETGFTALALTCAVIGSVPDVRERRIPNWLTGPSLILAIGLHGLAGGWRGFGGSLLAGLVAGGVMFLFFLAGGMGAGDVKLMAAVGCFVGLSLVGFCLVATALCGAALGVFLAVRGGRLRRTVANAVALVGHHRAHGLQPHAELHVGNAEALRMPFALPIAAGCLITFGARVWGV